MGSALEAADAYKTRRREIGERLERNAVRGLESRGTCGFGARDWQRIMSVTVSGLDRETVKKNLLEKG